METKRQAALQPEKGSSKEAAASSMSRPVAPEQINADSAFKLVGRPAAGLTVTAVSFFALGFARLELYTVFISSIQCACGMRCKPCLNPLKFGVLARQKDPARDTSKLKK